MGLKEAIDKRLVLARNLAREPIRGAWDVHRKLVRRSPLPLPCVPSLAAGRRPARVLMLTHDDAVTASQIYPFYYYARALARRHRVELWEMDVQRFLARTQGSVADRADIVVMQPWFSLGEDGIERLCDEVDRRCRPSRRIFLDGYAPTDLRFARVLSDRVDLYVKKHVLRDRKKYGKTTAGDTNLTDYASAHFGLDMPPVTFEVPQVLLDKLLVGPSFVTADYLLGVFERGELPSGPKVHDVHARLGRKGSDWFERMRHEALDALRDTGVELLSGFGVPQHRFLEEMSESRLCFSPFGYGEVAWRDFEAFAFGSLLIKPDMHHCETSPDFFVPGETYVPVRWDYADLSEKVHHYLQHDDERERIVRTAFERARDYVQQRRFLDQMAPLFAL